MSEIPAGATENGENAVGIYGDEVVAMTAVKHCKQPVVTASIDPVNFTIPARLGDI